MPIKPENRARYPKDWPAISLAARERARWQCQHPGCKATQYSVGRWICWAGGVHEWCPVEGNTPAATAQDREFFMAGEGRDSKGQLWTYKAAREFIERWTWEEDTAPIVIVLTVAHLNHTPEDCRPENLAAMCQRHHLAYDHDHHRVNAQATRRARSGTLELF
jgi:hypothetical protein